MPSIPAMCIGPNVRMKPMYSSQNCQRASRSESIRPVDLGIPVVDAGERAEQRAADQHPMKMADDEVAVGELEVERRGGQHDAGQAADQEHREKAAATNSIGEANEIRPPYIVASQLKNLMPVGIETSRLATTKNKSSVRLMPTVNM